MHKPYVKRGIETLLMCLASLSIITAHFQPTDVDCCKASKKTLCQLEKSIFNEVKTLEKQLSTCCSTIGTDLDQILKALTACGPVIPVGQAHVPYQARSSGYYCLKEDIFFDGSTTPAGAVGPTAFAFSGQNVVFDLNNHTIRIKGAGANAIVAFANAITAAAQGILKADPAVSPPADPRASTRIFIKNGTIIGSTDSAQSGILILTNNVTVSNVRIINLSGPASSGITIQGAFISSIQSPTILLTPLNDVLVEQCNLVGNYYGVQLDTMTNSVTIQDTAIDKSLQMGITQPSRKSGSSNVTINRVTISNSGLNGIFTTFSQANWFVRNTQVTNSGLNGMIFSAFQNLAIDNCQVYNSGAHGIDISIRQNKNVSLSHTQIFNCQDACLRVDNTENLRITDCEFANYNATPEPLVKLQDIFNGTVSSCQFNSLAGTSDGLFLRNVHGVTVSNSSANILCNQPRSSCPVGINVHGGVTTTTVNSCTVSGNPSVGIALTPDTLNGLNSGITVQKCTVQNAVTQGILVSQSSQCTIFGNTVSNGNGDGVFIDSGSVQTAVRDNTLTNNTGFGINNAGLQSSIFHNFASGNGAGNYTGVPLDLISAPTATTGVLVNVST